jgi:predicted RecA/RadA family phage recombinase
MALVDYVVTDQGGGVVIRYINPSTAIPINTVIVPSVTCPAPTASGAYTPGMYMVAVTAIPASTATPNYGAVQVAGLCTLAKYSTQTFAIGDLVYWHATNGCTSTATGSTGVIGWATKAAASGDTGVQILLNRTAGPKVA